MHPYLNANTHSLIQRLLILGVFVNNCVAQYTHKFFLDFLMWGALVQAHRHMSLSLASLGYSCSLSLTLPHN